MFRSQFFDCLRREVESFETDFFKLVERSMGWSRAKPAKSGFYYVRTVAQPDSVNMRFYRIEEGPPYESNTIMNKILPTGELEFLGPFGVGEFVDWMARESLGGNRTSIGICKVCETPVYVDEGSLEDTEGNVWHMECDGEDDFYEEAGDE